MEHFAQLTPIAVAVALSPMPIAALMLMLLSSRAKSNSIAFFFGWILGLALLVIIVASLVSSVSSTSTQSDFLKNMITGALGLALIIFAIKEWIERPKKGVTPQMPTWMKAIDSFSPIKAFLIGISLAMINFKNTPMGIAAANVIGEAGLNEQPELFVYYLIVGGSTILVPVILFLLFGKKIQGALGSTKEWLILHNNAIMFILFFILGAVLVSKAFGG